MKSSFQRALGVLCLSSALLFSACGGDTSNTCVVDTDCAAGKVCTGGACLAPGQCAPGVLSCSDTSQCGAQNICSAGCCTPVTGCATSNDCTSPLLPHCNATTHVCEKCSSNTQCTSGKVCSAAGRCEPACSVDNDCKVSGKTKCTSGGFCGECKAATDCTPAKPICGGGVCFGCASNADCGGATPVCNPDSKACVVCLEAQNSGGVNPACTTAGKNACSNSVCVTCVPSANEATGQNGACVATSVATPACSATSTCVACLASANDGTTGKNPLCGDATKPSCDATGVCGCSATAQCEAGKACDPVSKTCKGAGLASFTSSASTLSLGATATLTATLDAPAAAAVDIDVSLVSGGGSLAAPKITIALGSATGTVVYTAPGAADSVTVKASLGGVDKTVTLAVSSAPLALDTLTPAAVSVQAGATATLTATLSAQATTSTTIGLASSAAGTASVPASVTIAAGASSAAVTVTGVAANAAAATVTASYGGVEKTAAVTVFNLALTSLTPASASAAGGSTVAVTLAVTPPPGNATANVTVDGGAKIGGQTSADVTVLANATSTSFSVALPSAAGTVNVSATANGGAQVTTAITVTAASTCSPPVVISGVYGGGGGTGAYKCDLIELHNRSTTEQSVGGWSLQYGSSTGATIGSTNGVHKLPATKTIPAGAYLLIQEDCGTSAAAAYPVTPDIVADATSGFLSMSQSNGKVFLVSSQTTLSASTCPVPNSVVDFVGWGTANCSEGLHPTPATTNAQAVTRNSSGCADSNDNLADFALVTIGGTTFKSSATTPAPCASICQ